MSRRNVHTANIAIVARALGDLNQRVVFVGGAVAALYVDEVYDEDVRPTYDVDLTVEIASMAELEAFRLALEARGFKQSMFDSVTCRFRFGEVKVDVMSTNEIGWAPSNRWFASGFQERKSVYIEGQEVFVLPLHYYIASKFDAYLARGGGSPRTSHDIEDLVWLFDQLDDRLIEQMRYVPEDVRDFLKPFFEAVGSIPKWREAFLVHLPFDGRDERYRDLLSTMGRVIANWSETDADQMPPSTI